MANLSSLFNMADVFDFSDSGPVDTDMVKSSISKLSLDSCQSSIGPNNSQHSISGRSMFGCAPLASDGPESSDDDEDDMLFGSLRSAVESMMDQADDEDEGALKTPYFKSLPGSPRGSVSAVASRTQSNLSAMPRTWSTVPGIPHVEEGHLSQQPSPTCSFYGGVFDSASPRKTNVMSHSSFHIPRVTTVDFKRSHTEILSHTTPMVAPPAPSPALGSMEMDPRMVGSAGVVTIRGQSYILMPAASIMGGSTTPPLSTAQDHTPRDKNSSPIQPRLVQQTSQPQPAGPIRSIAQRTGSGFLDRKKTSHQSFPNIKVLSDKVDSTVEHGYYLNDSAAAPENSADAVPVPVEAKPPQSFPTYTYDYGEEVDKTVWDILRKSIRQSS